MLPGRLTRFFGRQAEVADLVGLVAEARWVSLVGPPGCGKTRLAVEVSARVEERFPGGVSFVELAAVSDPQLVVSVVAAEYGLGARPGRALVDTLVESLTALREPLLLVLDNCEHVADTVGALVERLVLECPSVHVLTTSRAALSPPGARVWRVQPLDVGDAARLFVDRANLASGAFRVIGPGDEALVEKICLQLDGLPLAIELIAAWTRVLSLAQIMARLGERFSVLDRDTSTWTVGPRTMSAAVDWSYQLLPAEAQQLFERLSLFAGGFDLEAVEAVAAPSNDVLGALTTLVDHSLVVALGESQGSMRYRVLEPVRQCGEALLVANGGGDEARRRWAEYYLGWVERFDPLGLRGVHRPLPHQAVAQEESNLIAALAWARHQPPDLGLRLCEAMAPYWLTDGRVNDGRLWLRELLGHGTPDARLRARALEAAGSLAWRAGDYDEAHRWLDDALNLAGELGDLKCRAAALVGMARLAVSEGDAATATAVGREALTLSQRIDDGAVRFWALIYLGWASYILGDVSAGDEQLRAARSGEHPLDPSYAAATVLFGLQYGAFLAGDPAAQRGLVTEALALLIPCVQQEADWLAAMAILMATEDRPHTALRLFGGAGVRIRRRGSQLPQSLTAPVAELFAKISADVGPDLANRLVAVGETMSWPELVAQVTRAPTSSDALLTPRENQIAVLVAEGLTNVGIAEALVISRRTVESHVDHIRRKLGFRSRNQIIAWILQGERTAGGRGSSEE